MLRRLFDLDLLLRAALALVAALGAAAVASWAIVALAHVDDGYHVDHVAGAWMGLTLYADGGTFYPPLHEDERFGGTRYMPLPIALYTAAARLSGEYLVSGKVVALLVVAALLALVWWTARRLGAPWTVALGAVGAAIATFTGFFAGTTIYGDALPVLLQLGAVAVVLRGTSTRIAIAAGVLCGLAFAAKLSALWGAAAVLAWLVTRDRRAAGAFVAAALVTVAAVLGLAELVSDGRFGDNVTALAFSGATGNGDVLSATVRKSVDVLAARADATLLLLPIAIVIVALATWRRQLDPVSVALVPAVVVTFVVLTDRGTDFNHLLDLAVLIPLVVAGGYARFTSPALRLGLAIALAVAIVLSLSELRPDLREAASTLVHRETPERLRPPPLDGVLAGPVFSEDPSVDVERDRRPVALDSFTLLRLLEEHPDWERELVARFDRREFATVVLIQDLDLADPWWSESHLGLEVATAIDRNYRLSARVPGPVFRYRLYVPRSGQTSTASSATSTRSRASTSQEGSAASSSSR